MGNQNVEFYDLEPNILQYSLLKYPFPWSHIKWAGRGWANGHSLQGPQFSGAKLGL